MKYKWLSAFLGLLIILFGVYYILDPENKELNETVRARLGGTYIKLSDGITHYKLDGPNDGKVVVLVHGGTIPIWTWDKQVKALKDAGYRVLSYDQYGRGYSDRPDLTYDQELYKRQLLELVDKLALTKPFDLIGLSVGGGTSVNFTARYPHRVRKLVMISPLINNFKVPSFFRIPVFGEFIARLIGVRVIVNRFVSLLEKNPESEKYTKLFVEQTTYKGFQRSILSMLRNDAVGDYSKAYQIVGKQKRDILLIWGTADTEITKEMIKDIRSFIPHLKFNPVEGVGHGIVCQKPDTVNSLIISFLQQ
ncbi:MAG: alpha/beta hydrolase [Deltaproteobacteria bacterium]|nr:alpha/beta hydrolase [Deltaproteobacteria bacterium]MBW2344919.1 alpha/beta hydrolase [Deltaproteobacteria bacterium]